MSYTKQTWQTGDVITADKLNHMEDGIAAGGGSSTPLIVTITETTDGNNTIYTMNKTAGEIINALPLAYVRQEQSGSGGVVVVAYGTFMFTREALGYVYMPGQGYMFLVSGMSDGFIAATLDDYPTFTDSNSDSGGGGDDDNPSPK